MKKGFNFTKAEKVGVAALAIIIVVLLLLLNMPRHHFVPNISVVDSTTTLTYVDLKESANGQDSFLKELNLVKFNPNHYDINDWRKIGFSKKQSQVILNYKKKIKRFKSAEDLRNCYVITSNKFLELEPYLVFNSLVSKEKNEPEKIDSSKICELNSADKQSLEAVNGIGNYYASAIIKYREQLGGYYNISQIKEIYGMRDENYLKIVNQLEVDTSLITKITISNIGFDQLKKHPYLNWKQSQIIISDSSKRIDKYFWQRLLNSEAFMESDIKRLKPYFK